MPCPSVVRVARPEDRQEIWRLFLSGHNENGQFSLAPEKVDWFVNRALWPDQIPPWDTGARGAIGVIGDIGKLEGVVFLTIGTFWYSHDKHLEEFLVYVDPECRKSFHARALINWMKAQSEKTQLPLFTGVVSNIRTSSKVALYERMVPKVGAFFLYHPGAQSVALSSAAAA